MQGGSVGPSDAAGKRCLQIKGLDEFLMGFFPLLEIISP